MEIKKMRRTNNLEMINTKFNLSTNQQRYYRNQLVDLLNKAGVISICLDSTSLFIEYRKEILDRGLIKSLLLEINFPMEELSNKSKNQVIFYQNHLIN